MQMHVHKKQKFLLLFIYKINENYEVDRKIIECGYIRYLPAEVSTINNPNSRIYVNIP